LEGKGKKNKKTSKKKRIQQPTGGRRRETKNFARSGGEKIRAIMIPKNGGEKENLMKSRLTRGEINLDHL